MRIFALLLVAAAAFGQSAADVARQVSQLELDTEECYRVREVNFQREDIRYYLTDGYLIFSKPLAGIRPAAVFVADNQGGDAEVILLPPNKGERKSLAASTGSPNLNEHFTSAVFVMTDGADALLLSSIRERGPVVKSLEKGLLIASQWSGVVRNIAASFETRVALDLLSAAEPRRGIFFAALDGKTLGSFDVIYDQKAAYQIAAGKTNFRDDRPAFEIWTMFASRSNRTRKEPVAEPIVSDYRIDATLAPPDLRMSAVTRFKLTIPQGRERVFPFDITRVMRIVSATVDGQPVEILQRESLRSNLIRNNGNELFLMVTPQPLEAGSTHEVEIRHEGSVVNEVDRQIYLVTSRGNWYPSRGVQFSEYDLTFRYPKALKLVAAGELVSEETDAEFKVSRYRSGAPIRIAGFNLGVYEKTQVSRKGLEIDVYANQALESAIQAAALRPPLVITSPPMVGRNRRPEVIALPDATPMISPKSRLETVASDVASAFEFFTGLFGPPPLKTLTVSPVPGAFGQGFPGLVYMSTMSYLGPGDRPIARLQRTQQIFFTELLYAHEVAHQWWGNVVTSAGYQDEWLMEALANYSAMMQLEKRKGPKALLQVLNEYRDDLLAKKDDGQTVDSTGPIALGMRLITAQSSRAWRTITYEKGSWILHMLRKRMGDAGFTKFLGELRNKFDRKPLTIEEFRTLAAQYMPPKSPDGNLEAFFDQWVYSTGIPEVELKYSVRGKAPAVQVTGTVKQSSPDKDSELLVPLEVQIGRGKAATHWVRANPEGQQFTIRLRQAPSKVLLDPEEAVLALKK